MAKCNQLTSLSFKGLKPLLYAVVGRCLAPPLLCACIDVLIVAFYAFKRDSASVVPSMLLLPIACVVFISGNFSVLGNDITYFAYMTLDAQATLQMRRVTSGYYDILCV